MVFIESLTTKQFHTNMHKVQSLKQQICCLSQKKTKKHTKKQPFITHLSIIALRAPDQDMIKANILTKILIT